MLLALLTPAFVRASNDIFFPEQWGCSPGVTNVNACMDERAGRTSQESGDRANSAEKNALRYADMGDQVDRDRNNLSNQLAQTQRQPTLEERRQAEENLLARSYQPPRDTQDTLRQLGLSTNRDLRDRGEKVRDELYNEAKRLADQSAKEHDNQRKAAVVSQRLGDMSKTSEERKLGMMSHQGQAILKAGTEGKSMPEGGGTGTEYGRGEAPGSTIGERTFSPTAEKDDASSIRTAQNTLRIVGGHRAKPGDQLRSSLRALLLKKIAAANSRGDHALADQLTRELAKAEGETGSRTPASTIALNEGKVVDNGENAAVGFSSMGSLVKDLRSEVYAQGGGEDGDGPSLFLRIRRSIRSCLDRKCL